LNRVATSTEGSRNENLNRAAFTIGGLLHTGTPNIEDARRVLYDAAVACGLAGEPNGDRSIRATIESGLTGGQSRPLTPTGRPGAPAQLPFFNVKWHGDPHEAPRWLVKKLLPKRGVALIAGQSGVGKSFVVLDLASALATGIRWYLRHHAGGATTHPGPSCRRTSSNLRN
jgi:hypothetical protein